MQAASSIARWPARSGRPARFRPAQPARHNQDRRRERSMKLLDGIRVLDMTNVLAGPFATLHLALAGAEVIKIENPDGGDLARKLGNAPELNQQLMGTSFLAQNTNKKSLTLKLKEPAAKEIFARLVGTAD